MGVHGLWDLLLTTAQKTTIQKLAGKILAIDASIWLVKAQSIFSEDHQKIKIILQKIVYLRKNNILPVFVFDGVSPAIKRRTLQKRRQRIHQVSEIDIRKKTQIQVMHLLENAGKKNKQQGQSSKDKKIVQKQQEMKQVNKLLANLNQIELKKSQQISMDDINKIRLQSQVLTYKYQLLLQDPKLYGLSPIRLQEFSQFEIQQKLDYLHNLQQDIWSGNYKRNHYQQMKQLSKRSPDEVIIQQMGRIQKKSKLRSLQDQLYRKAFNNNIKIQNGFQIIQQVRNGRKITMKRKIKEQNKTDYFTKNNKKQKNDFSTILNYKSKKQQSQISKDQYDGFGNQPDQFLIDLISSDLSKNKIKSQQVKPPTISFLSKRQKQEKVRKVPTIKVSEVNQKKIRKQQQMIRKQQKNNKKEQPNKFKQKPKKNQQKKQRILNRYLQESSDINEVQFSQNSIHSQEKPSHAQQQSFGVNEQNLDHLPSFINYQSLSLQHLDSQVHRNIQFQKLLQMLGIPYLKAIGEAQAECAHLEIQGLVDGIVTQDSDVFLFGAQNVYRGVFNDNIKYFSSHIIKEKLNMNREKFIIFAMLLGSDYTDGIKGIGIVNAMQILKIFDTFDKIRQFKKWARYADILHVEQKNTTCKILQQLSNQDQKCFYQFHKRYKNYWYIPDNFPKEQIISAYISPQIIDTIRTKQLHESNFLKQNNFHEQVVRIFMKDKLLLTYNQIDLYCKGLRKQFRREKQQKLTEFFGGDEFAKIRSKRLLTALNMKPNQSN